MCSSAVDVYAMTEMIVTGTVVDADRLPWDFHSCAHVFRFVGSHVIKMHQLELLSSWRL